MTVPVPTPNLALNVGESLTIVCPEGFIVITIRSDGVACSRLHAYDEQPVAAAPPAKIRPCRPAGEQ